MRKIFKKEFEGYYLLIRNQKIIKRSQLDNLNIIRNKCFYA